ncbi:MAG: radical SAM protein [Deltaproteobacteria bacterium]|nr:radical SAM protein [Deltaproteobacteria bacterium]MBI4373335.1 radical SAM protein [Deltaproteobacteria bacterium]
MTTAKKIEGIYKYLRIKTTGWPKLINLEVTKLCNAQCDFCPCWEIKDYPQLKDYTGIMKKFRPIVLSLNGGEPLLRKDLLDIIDQARPYCTYLTVITHGGLLTEEKYRELWDHGVDQLSISRNYIDETHDQERHLPGLTDHFKKLVPNLASQGFDNIVFNTVIMDRNIEHIVPLAKQAREWGAKISFSSYSALKNDKPEYSVVRGRLARLQETVDELLALKKEHGHILTSEYYLKRVPGYFKNGYVEDCRAGLNFIQMTPDGYIKRCSEMPVMMHWTEYDPAKVEKPNPCNVCWLSCRGETETPITPSRLWELVRH